MNKLPQNHKQSKNILPFVLGLILLALAGWLFIPWLLEPKVELAEIDAPPHMALAELIREQEADHVFFAPQAHSQDTCNQCHMFDKSEYLAMFKMEENSKDVNGTVTIFYNAEPMSMAECQSCHAIPAHLKSTTAGEECGTCHR